MPTPAVLKSPQVESRLKRGFDRMADVLTVTLGPTQGLVLSQANTGGQPELLTDAATIARRLMQLPDRAEDVGAMLLRNLVWRMHLKAGDGCATAAVLAQAILAHALEAPFRRIVANVGRQSPAVLLAQVRQQGAGLGYDARRDRLVALEEAGILDPVGVLRLALETAVSGAAMALTTEVMVLKRNPQQSMEP